MENNYVTLPQDFWNSLLLSQFSLLHSYHFKEQRLVSFLSATDNRKNRSQILYMHHSFTEVYYCLSAALLTLRQADLK